MNGMFALTPGDLFQLKGAGGERFAHFADRLIRAEAARGGLAQSEILTQLRVSIKDGGVDTQVKKAIPGDPTGWFGVPTCWQFKAVEATNVNEKDLREEIHKPYVKRLISEGFGYRLCLLGDLTAEKQGGWETLLRTEVQVIDATTPDPRIVHGGYLPQWAERFPAVVAWLRVCTAPCLLWEAWLSICRSHTRTYVPNPEWECIREQIQSHADFSLSRIAGDPCMTVAGTPGVGKTRLVFETLAESDASPGLVLCTQEDRDATQIALQLANASAVAAILVADECTAECRRRLDGILCGSADRVRVICIDNAFERHMLLGPSIWLSADKLTNTDDILQANFPEVPRDRRHQYAQLSRGFIRLAVDMCRRDAEFAGGDISGMLVSVDTYIRQHPVVNSHLDVIAALALFDKVGFREDVKGELELLCGCLKRQPDEFRNAVHAVREGPGFVAQAGRYWYVTPEIVARALFAVGWKRWVSSDVAAFLRALPPDFQKQLIDRAGKLGDKEVRDHIVSFLRSQADALTAADLADSERVALLETIIEADPKNNLPYLRAALEHAAPQQVLAIRGDAEGWRWGPRRTLVWLLERLVAFPEYFADCEECLFRLAVNETEPQIGNNASAIWQRLFGVYLSGSAAPFSERLETLRRRTVSPDLREAALAFEGVQRTLGGPSAKIIGRPMVAGRLRPQDWRPQSREEEIECYRAVIKLCAEHLKDDGTQHRRLAFDALLDGLFFILCEGFASDLQQILRPIRLTDEESRRLINGVDHFLELEIQPGPVGAGSPHEAYCQLVREWIDKFRPTDFDGRLRSVVSREPWDRRFAETPEGQANEIDVLTLEIMRDPNRLHSHLDWLATAEAQSAGLLGFAVGTHDESFTCGRLIFEYAIAHGAAPLLRGYVRAMGKAKLHPPAELLDLTDQLEVAHPEVAVDILANAGDTFDALNRVIKLVEDERVATRYLASFARGVGLRNLTPGEANRIVPYFLKAAQSGDGESARSGLRFLSTFLQFHDRHSGTSCLDNKGLRRLSCDYIEASIPHVEGQMSHEWSAVVKRLCSYEPDLCARLCGQALLSDHLGLCKEAASVLLELADTHPQATIQSFGGALLDTEEGWRMQVPVYRDLVSRLPVSVAMEWVRRHGIGAARAIARHLPRPYVDETGRGIVPEILESLFNEYDDDDLFGSFVAGAHSGEVWRGNPSDELRQQAENARKFLHDPNHRIREWAQIEIKDRSWFAEREDREQEERFLAE